MDYVANQIKGYIPGYKSLWTLEQVYGEKFSYYYLYANDQEETRSFYTVFPGECRLTHDKIIVIVDDESFAIIALMINEI